VSRTAAIPVHGWVNALLGNLRDLHQIEGLG
jgi:hypothetical protein